MGVVKYTSSDISLLARLIRAEAEGEGTKGMLLVGNVVINRVRVDCAEFKEVRTIRKVIYQKTAFEALEHGYFYQRARESERRLARRVINGERFWPAKFSLWFFRPPGDCPPQWYNQPLVGRYKRHCFFEPTGEHCEDVYQTF
ncbi:cell wall hydrolase [Cytobacillus oceanisediminis]|jgi:N-acetylmuramoyl-L-alanine amidase|uniref:cell wall hydrolase n=1 Tax=Cytobacillus oceanisediminis TaxID=665099 RepID=UPI002041FE4D|nr:cell wall hydrolase [Cytobacillus oceanisediminis]MCM3405337.1 cell wall hydrolase [Cytobacillus oceanisediminis]